MAIKFSGVPKMPRIWSEAKENARCASPLLKASNCASIELCITASSSSAFAVRFRRNKTKPVIHMAIRQTGVTGLSALAIAIGRVNANTVSLEIK